MAPAERAREALRAKVARTPLQRRVDALLDRIEYRRVETEAELAVVRRHRHAEYVAAGNIEPRADGMMEDADDHGTATRVYTAWLDGALAGSVRLSVLRGASREGLTIQCFPDIVEPMLDTGTTVIDPNRLTTASALSRTEPALIFAVLRLATMAASHYGAEHCLTPIRPHHGAFYRRFLHATRLCEGRVFPGTSVRMELYDVHVPSAFQSADRGSPFIAAPDRAITAIFPSEEELGLSPAKRAVG